MSINLRVNSDYDVDLNGLSSGKNVDAGKMQTDIKTSILDDVNTKTTNVQTETIDLNISPSKVNKVSSNPSSVNKVSTVDTNVGKHSVSSSTTSSSVNSNLNSNVNSNTINHNSNGGVNPSSVNSNINQNVNIDSNKTSTDMAYNKILNQETSKKSVSSQNNATVTPGGATMSNSNFSFSNSSLGSQGSGYGNSGEVNGNLSSSETDTTVSKGKTASVGDSSKITNYKSLGFKIKILRK